MFRPAHLPTRRPLVVLVAGAVLAASTIAGAASAQAATPVADMEGTALRIAGPPVSGTTIPAGTLLTPVRLTTSDPSDDDILIAGQPEFRSDDRKGPRFVIPAIPAETATFRVNGATVATSVPTVRGARLVTDQGRVDALVFTAGGVSYAIPRLNVPVGAVSRTVASSTVNTGTVTSFATYSYSLLPVGAQPRAGIAFRETTSDGISLAQGTVPATVFDADSIRGNSDSAAEELVLRGRPPTVFNDRLTWPGIEVWVTVTLSNGTTQTIRGVRHEAGIVLAPTTWLFDRAALAAAGATIADVTGVVSSTTTDHALTWQDLGFDLI